MLFHINSGFAESGFKHSLSLATSRSTGNMIPLLPDIQATFQIKQVVTYLHYHPLVEWVEDSKKKKQVWTMSVVLVPWQKIGSQREEKPHFIQRARTAWTVVLEAFHVVPPLRKYKTNKQLWTNPLCLLIPMDSNSIFSPHQWILGIQYNIPNNTDKKVSFISKAP